MEIANGLVVLSKDHTQPKYEVTPAEAIVLHKLHLAGSKGIPLQDFVVLDGEAVTVIGKKKVKVKRKNLEGNEIEVEVDEPITRKRTGPEELARLKRLYPGTVKGEDGKSAPVCNVCFPGAVKRLPETFAELEGELLGINEGFFKRTSAPEGKKPPEGADKRGELMALSKPQLVDMAQKLELTVEPAAKKAEIVEMILKAAAATDAVVGE